MAQAQTPGSDVARMPRNLDPAIHPFAKAREYTRALNAAKMDRMFAAPFVGQMGKGHVDGCVAFYPWEPSSLKESSEPILNYQIGYTRWQKTRIRYKD